MFYFRFWLYRLVKPFVKPIAPDKAFKYHSATLFAYVFIAANLAMYAWHKSKEKKAYEDEIDPNLTGIDKIKDKHFRFEQNPDVIVRISPWTGVEKTNFNLEEYRKEKQKIKDEFLRNEKVVGMI